jgi:hypothetical protein
MQDAPAGSVFVWGGGNTLYAKQLAAHLGRDDLEIQPFLWLTPHNVRKGKLPVVIVDHHAVDLAWRQCWAGQARQALEYLRSCSPHNLTAQHRISKAQAAGHQPDLFASAGPMA